MTAEETADAILALLLMAFLIGSPAIAWKIFQATSRLCIDVLRTHFK